MLIFLNLYLLQNVHSGFNEVRKYVFGDQLVNAQGCESTGIPVSAGYAVGYHAVQGFIKNTGISVEEATLINSDEIIIQLTQ
ncbi:DUF2268 domain-containing putative Zn-dependent protease [Clostridium faecium]|uniref:DUF2268 domain-containing putative Zn-dependent protease n=1 Tax=Clostridium butanoliproducens TaxID=2991837 RepID=UPI001A9AC6EA